MSNPITVAPYHLKTTRLSDVEMKEVSWLWKPYIPSGKITVLEGDPEAGKTFLSLEIAAHLTTGRPLPSYGVGLEPQMSDPANVVFLGAEDDLADTIRPRFESAGGDSSRFIALEGYIRKDDKQNVTLGISLSDIQKLDRALRQSAPKLLIVDPFQAFLGSGVDMHRANEIRPVMAGLKTLAETHDCAVLLIRHLAKAGYGKAMYQGLGSIDIIAAARSVLVAGVNRDPSLQGPFNSETGDIELGLPKNQKVLAQSKCNIAQRGPSISYGIENGKLHFGGTVEITADELTGPVRTKGKPRKDASQFLREVLINGPLPVKEVYEAAGKQFIAKMTLDRAASDLGVIRRPVGFGGAWEMFLPHIPIEVAPCEDGDSESAAKVDLKGGELSAVADSTSLPTDESAAHLESTDGQLPETINSASD